MKKYTFLLVTLLIVNRLTGLLQAQADFGADEIKDLAKSEREAKAMKFASVQSEVGSNYDVKWYRCWWNIDPAVFAISGNVTTLFAPVGTECRFHLIQA